MVVRLQRVKQLRERYYARSSTGNRHHTHCKLKEPIIPHRGGIYRMLEQVLEMSAPNFRACWISGEMFIMYCLKFMSRNIWYCAVCLTTAAWARTPPVLSSRARYVASV